MAQRCAIGALPLLSVPLALAVAFACARGEPPSFAGDGSAAPLAPASITVASAASTAPSSAPSTEPHATHDEEQTRDRPSSKTPAFETRALALWEAIATDKPELARPMFFPVNAYEKVKAVQNPAADWRRRLVAAYDRDIRDLHAQIGERASRAKFVALEVPDDRGKWVEPGEEYNKLGYYRVFGARLKYEIGGRERSFIVKSLISWRGEWYVVHLSAMK